MEQIKTRESQAMGTFCCCHCCRSCSMVTSCRRQQQQQPDEHLKWFSGAVDEKEQQQQQQRNKTNEGENIKTETETPTPTRKTLLSLASGNVKNLFIFISSNVKSLCYYRKNSSWSRLTTRFKFNISSFVLLPLLCIFLLPTLRLDDREVYNNNNYHIDELRIIKSDHQRDNLNLGTRSNIWPFGALLGALLKLPLDRLRLQSGLTLMASSATVHQQQQHLHHPRPHLLSHLNQKSDLQEEEQTNSMQLMLAPAQQAERRSSYGSTSGQQQYADGNVDLHTGPYGTTLANDAESATVSVAHGGGGASAETSAGAEQQVSGALTADGSNAAATTAAAAATSSTSAIMQARSDLPAVRALNVKCEKNHMTVSCCCWQNITPQQRTLN